MRADTGIKWYTSGGLLQRHCTDYTRALSSDCLSSSWESSDTWLNTGNSRIERIGEMTEL